MTAKVEGTFVHCCGTSYYEIIFGHYIEIIAVQKDMTETTQITQTLENVCLL